MRLSDSCKTSRHGMLATVVACGLIACGDGTSPPANTEAAEFDGAMKQRISVSGVSSGGYMAVQTHVALADRIGGVAAIAAGPYHCAGGDAQTALGRCMTGQDLDAAPMIEFARSAAAAQEIAATGFMQDARVWVFHSPEDGLVSPSVGDALVNFYETFVAPGNITQVSDVIAAHGWITSDNGRPCGEQGGDFINDCDYDAAGELLRRMYGALEARGEAGAGRLMTVDLSGYFPGGSGVADTGLVYVPVACDESYRDCRLHVAFHGCVQGAEFIDDRFATQAGLNEWAETNRIIVVYPQVEKSLFNPTGCWDWWGYTGDDYDLRSGKQVSGTAAIIDAFASGKLLHNHASH